MKIITKDFHISTKNRCEFIDITNQVGSFAGKSGISDGDAIVYCPHTTAGITINENADRSVIHDILLTLEELIPHRRPGYRHSEGNSDSHCKSSLKQKGIRVGTSALAILLTANLAEAVSLPSTLVAALGRLAIAGVRSLGAVWGGMIMAKKMLIMTGVFAILLLLVYPVLHWYGAQVPSKAPTDNAGLTAVESVYSAAVDDIAGVVEEAVGAAPVVAAGQDAVGALDARVAQATADIAAAYDAWLDAHWEWGAADVIADIEVTTDHLILATLELLVPVERVEPPTIVVVVKV